MWNWLRGRLRALRTRALVRLGLWRGRWRRGRIRLARSFFGVGVGARTWRYGLYTPGGLRDEQEAPLVVLLHGCGQRALGFAHASGWTRFADRSHVRLLCPEQRRLANMWRCWNWFLPLAQRGHGELEVIDAMIEEVRARVRVDDGSIAVVGLSAGGALAALLAFHRPDKFGAVVAVAGLPLTGASNVQDPRSVMRHGLAMAPLLALGAGRPPCAPLAIVHGAADEVVNPRCAAQLQEQALETLRRAGIEAMASEPGAAPDITTTDYHGDGRLRVRRVEIGALGHEWTGGPGGHPHCREDGPPLTRICAAFLRDVRVIPS